MKKLNKLCSLLLVAVLAVGTLLTTAACGHHNGPVIEEDKTQLYVSNYDAGIGRSWLETLANDFAEEFANYSFEEGKRGVQFIFNHNSSIASNTAMDALEYDSDNIYFTEGINYKYYAKKGKFADITDVLNQGAVTGVDDNGNILRESKTVKSKIAGECVTFLDVGDTEAGEKYCGVPFYLGLKGLNYSIDVWNQYELYFAKDGAPSEVVAKALNDGTDVDSAITQYYNTVGSADAYIYVNKKGELNVDGQVYNLGLSAGPDGKYGTPDDGLPATYEEFYVVIERMINKGVTPFIWSGKNPGYADQFTTMLWQNNAGKNSLSAFYNLEGTIDDLVVFNADGTMKLDSNGNFETESITFTGGAGNGYEAQRTASKYYALQFAEKLGKTSKWVNATSYESTSQQEAQTKYLTYGYTNTQEKKCAMMMDGSWWQQEAKETFTQMEKKNSAYGSGVREFGMMYLPCATIEIYANKSQSGLKNTFVDANDSFMFINGNLKEGSAQLTVAKLFLSYLQNDNSVNVFSEKTNISRPLDVKITDETKAKMSFYGRYLVEYKENSDVCYAYTDNAIINEYYTTFQNSPKGIQWHMLNSKENIEVYFPVTSFHNYPNLTAKTYFESMYSFYKNKSVW